LELKHPIKAPDWQGSIERQLCLQVIIDQLPHEARHMLHYRIIGLSWKEIGRAFGLSAKQARSRFYYELNKVQERFLASQSTHKFEELD
jgi:DNA-directed RNA polymerase specialized sigma24 family protein